MSEALTTELGFALSVAEREEEKGRWPDLTRLEARRPDILAAIVWMLARAVSVKSICRALKVSPCTVNRVRHDPKWRDAVVSESKGVVEKLDEILSLTVEDMLEQCRDGKMPSVFDLKLLFDIRQLLSGGATQRVETRTTPEVDDFERFMLEARRTGSIEVPGMVLEGEFSPAMGAAVKVGAEGREVGSDKLVTDLESVVSESQLVEFQTP